MGCGRAGLDQVFWGEPEEIVLSDGKYAGVLMAWGLSVVSRMPWFKMLAEFVQWIILVIVIYHLHF